MPIYEPGDVVVVPFPFTDLPVTKRRPALVLSAAAFQKETGHAVCAMITTAQASAWPSDHAIGDLRAAGLTQACVVRMKLFTIDAALVLRRAGRLAAEDWRPVSDRVGRCCCATMARDDSRCYPVDKAIHNAIARNDSNDPPYSNVAASVWLRWINRFLSTASVANDCCAE